MIALVSVSVALIALILIGTIISVAQKIKERDVSSMPGNAKEYDPAAVEMQEPSVLTGKNILFLGSSVTLGTASGGVSFADYIAKRNGATYVKEAVGGTTLASGKNSYLRRLKMVEAEKFDLFVCQLSTNDANGKKPLGSIDDKMDNTVSGAINAIVSYVREKWDCPIVFYTNAYFESDPYAAMVKRLEELAEKDDFGVIDLYTDTVFNDIDKEQKNLFMADDVHPTRAGYLCWWTPRMEEYLKSYLKVR